MSLEWNLIKLHAAVQRSVPEEGPSCNMKCHNRKRGPTVLVMTSCQGGPAGPSPGGQKEPFRCQHHSGRTNLFSLQGRYRVPQAVKAVFDVVPTLALQCIVVCPFVCLQ